MVEQVQLDQLTRLLVDPEQDATSRARRGGHERIDCREGVGIYGVQDLERIARLRHARAQALLLLEPGYQRRPRLAREKPAHALGEGVSPIRLRTVAATVFTRPEIAAVGVPQSMIDNGSVSARTIMLPLRTNARAKMSGLRQGFVKVFCRRSTGVVIGGVVVAPIASELILPIAVAVQNRITVNELAQTLAVYPSLSGSITEAARRLMAHDDLD